MANESIARLLAAAFLFIAHSALAADPRPAPRTIVGVRIQEFGKSQDEGEREIDECKAFRPTPRDIREFFLKSYPVPARLGQHDRYSPCHATGTVEFSDNTRGKWKISSSGAGTLFWDTGDTVDLFYGDYRWKDPFACSYGSSSEGEC